MSPSDMNNGPSLGEEVRKLRKAKGKSLAYVANAINRSVSFISQVERGHTDPSIPDLKAIAKTLGVPLGWFFSSDSMPATEKGKIVRSDTRRKIGTVTDGLVEELLSPSIGGSFEMILSKIEPGAAQDTVQRTTEEEVYVISGQLDLWINEQAYQVTVGDSFRIANEPFRWKNNSNVPVLLVWVISPPMY